MLALGQAAGPQPWWDPEPWWDLEPWCPSSWLSQESSWTQTQRGAVFAGKDKKKQAKMQPPRCCKTKTSSGFYTSTQRLVPAPRHAQPLRDTWVTGPGWDQPLISFCSTTNPEDRPRPQALPQHTAKMLQLDQLSLDHRGTSKMKQLPTSGGHQSHHLPVPHPHCPRQLVSLICFISPEQQLLPRLLFDDVEFVVMSERSRHLFVCHVHPVLEEEKNWGGI